MWGISSKWSQKVNLQVSFAIIERVAVVSAKSRARLEPFKEGSRV